MSDSEHEPTGRAHKIKINNDLLLSLGLHDLTVAHRNAVLKAIYVELELRVGSRIAETMTSAQLAAFGAFVQANDEEGAQVALEDSVPAYREIVAEEFAQLRSELADKAAIIETLSQQAPD